MNVIVVGGGAAGLMAAGAAGRLGQWWSAIPVPPAR